MFESVDTHTDRQTHTHTHGYISSPSAYPRHQEEQEQKRTYGSYPIGLFWPINLIHEIWKETAGNSFENF